MKSLLPPLLALCLASCATLQPPLPPAPPLAIDAPSITPDGLTELIQYIQNYPHLAAYQKKILIDAIQPSFYRKYFYVDQAPDLTNQITLRIKEQFQRATGLKPEQLILYGVTDTNAQLSHSDQKAQITYLLPAFRRLKTMEEKMTALIHENEWVLNPGATYLDVVTTEMAFEAALQKPNDTVRQIAFTKNFLSLNPGHDVNSSQSFYGIYWTLYQTITPQYMKLLLKRDLETGALKGFLNDQNQFTNIQLFGSENINCSSTYDICKTQLLNYLDGLLRTYPQSLLLSTAIAPMENKLVRPSLLMLLSELAGRPLYGTDAMKGNSDAECVPFSKHTRPMLEALFLLNRKPVGYSCNKGFRFIGSLSSESVTLQLTTDSNSPTLFQTDADEKPVDSGLDY